MIEELKHQLEALQRERASLQQKNAALQQRTLSLQKESLFLREETEVLRETNETLVQKIDSQERKIRALMHQLHAYAKQLFGRRSEKINPDQLALHFAELVQETQPPAPSADSQAPDDEDGKQETSKERKKRRGSGRKPLPKDLPRERIEHPPASEELVCPGCGETRCRIGNEITEQLEYRPATFVILEHVRPKYACKQCPDEGVTIADLPARPIEKGRPGPGLLARVLTAKYDEHLPLNRLERIFQREGVGISRSTMCDWVRDGTFLLRPIHEAMKRRILESSVIQSDDTPVRMQENWKKGGTRQCHLWSYVGDRDEVVFEFTRTRSGDGPKSFLQDYEGYLQADAFAGYNALYRSGKITEVGCWAHCRRKFVEAMDYDVESAPRALALIQLLYQVEAQAKEQMATSKLLFRHRKEDSARILAALRDLLDELLQSPLRKDPLSKAVKYAHDNWDALCRYIDDPKLSIDNNACERTIRRVAIGRKNWLFTGSQAGGERAALIYSIVETCRLQKIDVFAYLRDVLDRVSFHPMSRIDELTPRGWKAIQERRESEQPTRPEHATATV